MLNFFQHEALDKNRSSRKIKKAFSELYGDTEIYLLVDKVSFNPPETEEYKFAGSPLHWDVSLQLPIPFVLQGLLYLNDVSAEDGAFHCVPGFHKRIDNWLADLPEGANPRAVAIEELTPVAVPGNAGDLVIWHQALPHCATPNNGTTPRMVQYITYKPLQEKTAEIWK
jgi:ectoine hydroxylase-related dioxygenase (phytanoyl-CoA dioxygenase family)